MCSKRRHCVVVGGGIQGLCCALELRRAGLEVTVLERGRMGQEASAAAGGILCPLHPWRMPPTVQALAEEGRRLYTALAESLTMQGNIDPGLIVAGMLILAEQEHIQARAWADAHGVKLEYLSAAEQQPGLDGTALWLPEVACINNRRLLRALLRVLTQDGVVLRPETAVCGFEFHRGRLCKVQTEQEALPCETAVVAAGAWSGELLAEFNLRAWVYPVRGQMIALSGGAPNPLRCVVLRKDRYLIPRGPLVLVGSTLEAVGFEKKCNAPVTAALAHDAVAILPTLADRSVRARWAGLRPASADGLPLIGAVPGTEGLYLATGHYRNGVLTAPATARMLTALITRDEGLPAAFNPARPLPAVRAAL